MFDDSISGDDQGRVMRVLLPDSLPVQAQTSTAHAHVANPNVTDYPLRSPAAVAVRASGEIFIADRGGVFLDSKGTPGQVVHVDLLGIGSAFGPEMFAPADVALVPEPGLRELRGIALLALAIFARKRVRDPAVARSER